MADIKNIQKFLDELQNKGAFTDASGTFYDDDAKEHIRARIDALEQEKKKWDELVYAIKGYHEQLNKLSNGNYFTFNVKDWKKDLNKTEKDYKNFFKTLQEESNNFNAKWGKATKEQIAENFDEWSKDNNKLLAQQQKSLEQLQKLAGDTMDAYRNGMNIFDRWTPRIQEMFKGMVKGVNEMKDGMNKMWQSYSSWVEPWAKANQAAADFSKNIGMGAAGMQNLLSETIRFANQSKIGINYNKSLEEMIKLQQEYANTIGRNVGLTDSYKESLAAMSAVMGDQKTADITGKLDTFGVNPNEVANRMGKMFADASKKGIAFSKYSENFTNNIKMAQNYTFANGVKGVASMAEKATKLKLEMQSVAQFAEKVNTVEGAITTGAKLQVLGGSFSQFANPLQMLYEGTSDAEGLQDRIINMFGNLGRFNKLTGEVEVSAFDRQRIKAAGEAIGVNSAELMEMIHTKGKRNEIANQMRGLGYSDELQELIMNTATFDTNGNAGVSINGEFVGVDQLAGREAELIALNQSESEDIKDIAKTLRGWDDTMQGFKKQVDAKQASWVQKSGLGSLGMQAVQYLGQANWALNTIVGVLTAGKAIGFGKGAYGTAAGATRTVAGALSPVRMNNFKKRMGFNGKDLWTSQRVVGKNIGVLNSPKGTITRDNLNGLIRDGYRSRGADLGINNGGIPLDENRAYNNLLSRPGMKPRGGRKRGTSGRGTPSVSPISMGGNISNSNASGLYSSTLQGVGGKIYTSDGLYLGQQGKNGVFTPGKDFKMGSGGRLYTKDGLYVGQRLKNGTFKYSKTFGNTIGNVQSATPTSTAGNGLSAKRVAKLRKMVPYKGLIRGTKALSGMAGGILKGGAAMMLGTGLELGSQTIDAKREKLIAEGKIKENSKEDWNRRTGATSLGWAGKGASTGAMIGMMIGGPTGALLGAAIGAVGGGVAGAIKGGIDKKKGMVKAQLLSKISRFINGRQLTGDYSIETLNRISKYLETNDSSYINQSDINALKSNGNDYNLVIKKKMARGGLINGPLHTNGGVSVAGTGIELEGGEFVINRKSALKNIGILKKINSGTNIQPQPLNTQSMMVAPNINTPQISNVGTSEIALKPLDININGTIKIDAGKGNQVDITKLLLDNPKFLRDITEMIEKQINITTNGGYNKEKSLNKF